MKHKPEHINIEFKPSDLVMTPQDIDRIQDRIVDMFVRDYFMGDSERIKGGVGASFPAVSHKDANAKQIQIR